MSKKVIAVWSVFIAIFALLGIFGAVNQKNLVPDDVKDPVYKPTTKENVKTCSASLNNVNAIYQFDLDENDVISRTIITYYNYNQDLEEYLLMEDLSKSSVNGLKVTLNGTSADFQTNIVLTNKEYVEGSTEDLSKIGLVLAKYTNYSTYTEYLNTMMPNFAISCD